MATVIFDLRNKKASTEKDSSKVIIKELSKPNKEIEKKELITFKKI